MRKILFLAVAFALVGSSAASAQVVDRTLGVRLGVSVADASTDFGDLDDTFSTDNQTGFVAGAFLNKYWGLFGGQLEASYIEKGAKASFSDFDVDASGSIDYLELAALVKLGIPLGIVRPGAFGGVGFDMKLSCGGDYSDEFCDSLSGTDWSGILGLDLAFYLAGFSIWGDGRYMFGLTDISDFEELTEQLEYKNQGFTFQAGIGFAI